MNYLQQHFSRFRENIIGIHQTFISPFQQEQPILYADWTASGRAYRPIETTFLQDILPFVANTHTETNITGSSMTRAYHEAREKIKASVNAHDDDVLISAASGMTGVVNKLQRILGLRVPEHYRKIFQLPEADRPVVFVTHMEHHSNHTSWMETIADVCVIPPDETTGGVTAENLCPLLHQYRHRRLKIAAITACSNVTGVQTPYPEIARRMHAAGGYCFVDFAASAPYVPINMHPDEPEAALDAIYFSAHKFLGGPGATGILLFNQKLYDNKIPDAPGGGTVKWTDPWGMRLYLDEIEAREDGGTPAFLQTMRSAMVLALKEAMDPEKMLAREAALLELLWQNLAAIPSLHILADQQRDRLGILSFYIDGLHYNLCVQLLNDRFGIQVRGGCSCAGTYGHYLLGMDAARSAKIRQRIAVEHDYSTKPGWVRISLHPTMTDEEVLYIADSIRQLAEAPRIWTEGYDMDRKRNKISCTLHPAPAKSPVSLFGKSMHTMEQAALHS